MQQPASHTRKLGSMINGVQVALGSMGYKPNLDFQNAEPNKLARTGLDVCLHVGEDLLMVIRITIHASGAKQRVDVRLDGGKHHPSKENVIIALTVAGRFKKDEIVFVE